MDREKETTEPLKSAAELTRQRMDPERLCVAVIPCKMSSKRLSKKNLRVVAGIPMVVYAAVKAKACPHIDVVVISTDDALLLEKEVPEFKSSLFEERTYIVQRSGPACHPEAAVYSVVQDALRLLALYGVVRQTITHVVVMQPNVPTLTQDVVDRLVKAVVEEENNVARHFNSSGKQTGGCMAYKLPAFQSAQLMDAYNFAIITADAEIHTENDLVMAEQVFKMRGETDHELGPS